ncbi:MAG: archaeosortase/exosortase family protein [Hyphomicrobiales bacterium]
MQNRQIVLFHWSRPTRHFVLKAAAFMSVFLLVYHESLIGRLLGPWVELTARMTVALLHLLGVEALRAGGQIHHPGGFAYEIYYRCTAVLPAALLVALIFASTAPLARQVFGMALGVSVLIALNLVRLVHLFLLGVYRPALFEVIHGVVWELILVMATVGLWWMWSRWAIRSHPPR